MRALITGIAGFAGRHLAEYLVRQGHADVYGIASPRSNLEGLIPLVGADHLHRIDLGDSAATQRILGMVAPEAVYHLAAQASVHRAWSDPAQTLTNNIVAQVNLLQAIIPLEHRPSVLIVGSADEYGLVQAEDLPVDEETPLRPINPYAVSKVAQDYMGLQYHLSHALHIVRVRPFNHIGPGQQPGFVVADFCQQIARIEAGVQEPLMRVGNLTARRDFTDVRDMVRGYHLALTRGQPGQVYNLGASRAFVIRDILDLLLSESAIPIRVEPDLARMRPSDFPIIVSDCRRIRDQAGWEPHIPLEQSLRDVLDSWRALVTHSTPSSRAP